MSCDPQTAEMKRLYSEPNDGLLDMSTISEETQVHSATSRARSEWSRFLPSSRVETKGTVPQLLAFYAYRDLFMECMQQWANLNIRDLLPSSHSHAHQCRAVKKKALCTFKHELSDASRFLRRDQRDNFLADLHQCVDSALSEVGITLVIPSKEAEEAFCYNSVSADPASVHSMI